MLDSLYQGAHHVQRLRASPLGALLDPLAEILVQRGHATTFIRSILRAIEHFSYWLGTQHAVVTADLVTRASARQFLHEHFPTCSCAVPFPRGFRDTRAAVNHLLRMLKQRDPARSLPPATPHDTLLAEYQHFLRQTCGLATETWQARLRYARELLQRSFPGAPVDFALLTPASLQDYFRRYAGRLKPASVKSLATSLRSFLRFLAVAHGVDPTLAQAIARPPCWPQDRLPRALAPVDLQMILDSFDTATATGRRDLAVVRCMCDLGLRVGEVIALTLDDIDWRQGILKVPAGKGRRERLLPLPDRLGQAITAYLRQGRPDSADRHLFLRHTVPVGTPLTRDLATNVLRRAYARATGRTDNIGTHVLRHTAATRMRSAGHSLKGIADVLGHRSVDTTTIYVKLDVEALRAVALPWQGGES